MWYYYIPAVSTCIDTSSYGMYCILYTCSFYKKIPAVLHACIPAVAYYYIHVPAVSTCIAYYIPAVSTCIAYYIPAVSTCIAYYIPAVSTCIAYYIPAVSTCIAYKRNCDASLT